MVSQAELQAAAGRTLPDLLAPQLRIVFCGINPGLYSGVTGHHFARPGNRFWPTLHAAGFTPRQFAPAEEALLLPLGYGITNLVARASARADELTSAELVAGGAMLGEKMRWVQPLVLAVLGITAYRTAFRRPKATLGPQPERSGPAQVWVLPNPSGLNAHYQLADLARVYRDFRLGIETAAN